MTERSMDEAVPGRWNEIRSEVNRLLDCISDAADHYKVLRVTRDASPDEIRAAYRRAVEHLHPLKCRDIIEIDGAMQWKLSQAFLRVVEAFTTLARPARRIEYDAVLNRRPTSPLPVPAITSSPPTLSSTGDLAAERPRIGSAFGHSERTVPKVADRRRVIRFALRLPVRVSSTNGEWQEVTESWDVSRLGIRIRLSRRVDPGVELRLELPMPDYLRVNNRGETIYSIVAVVRYVVEQNTAGYLIGAEFIPDSTRMSA